MINIKTKAEIKAMEKGGGILAEVLFEVIRHIKPGISEMELDALAEELIVKKGGTPGFKRVEGYRHTICVSTNEVVVHGIPTDYKLKTGDVIGIDCGVYFEGLHTDMAETVIVGKTTKNVEQFLTVGKNALLKAIQQVKAGNRVGHISSVIQKAVEEEAGFSVTRSLVGHGVGKHLHEEPEVPGFLDRPIAQTPLLKEGMTIAVEVIYAMGSAELAFTNNDGWTLKTKDNSLSGLFERTVLVTQQGSVVLTK